MTVVGSVDTKQPLGGFEWVRRSMPLAVLGLGETKGEHKYSLVVHWACMESGEHIDSWRAEVIRTFRDGIPNFTHVFDWILFGEGGWGWLFGLLGRTCRRGRSSRQSSLAGARFPFRSRHLLWGLLGTPIEGTGWALDRLSSIFWVNFQD